MTDPHRREARMARKHTPWRHAFALPWPGTRRGLVLWLLSIAVVIIGGANYVSTTLPERTTEALAPMLAILPSTGWGFLFIGAGVASGFFSYCHFDRDHIGYSILTGLTGMWAAGWLLGFIFDWLDDGTPDWRIVGSSVIWLVFCLVLLVVRGFPPTPLPGRCHGTLRAPHPGGRHW